MNVRALLLLLAALGSGLCRQTVAHAQAAPAPTAYDADPQAYRLIASELKALEQARSEIGIAGPIGWTITGGIVTGGGAFFLLVGLLLESAANLDCEPTTPEGSELCDEGDYTPIIAIGAVAAIAGVVILAVALPTLFSRIDERRQLGVRIKELRRELGHAAVGSGQTLARSSPVLRLRF